MKDEEDCSKYLNIRTLGVILFMIACCFCVYKISELSSSDQSNGKHFYYKTELKLVNAFCRHGDRGPSEELPPGDEHASEINFFWPNGMANLTDAGRIRQFRLGHALRRRYTHLSTNASKLLVLSSNVFRCREAAEHTMRGYFNLDQTRQQGLRLMRDLAASCFDKARPSNLNDTTTDTCARHHLPSGSGSPAEWAQVQVDTKLVPTLDWHYLDACKCRKPTKECASPIESDLLLSDTVRKLDGVFELRDMLKQQYNLSMQYPTVDHWSTILTELRLERTRQTIKYTKHFASWINKKISLEPKSKLLRKHTRAQLEHKLPSLFDVFEALALYVYRDRIPQGLASRIQLGPMLSSLVDAQQVALAATNASGELANKEQANRYQDKRMVLYFTHDTILQHLMFRMRLIEVDESKSYAERFVRAYELEQANQFLAGLRMAEFGSALVFELHEMKQYSKKVDNGTRALKSFAFVQASLYYQEDPYHAPIDFKPLQLGTVCQQLFHGLFPEIERESMRKLFYDEHFVSQKQFSSKLSCPFELFRNVTMQHYRMDTRQLESHCL